MVRDLLTRSFSTLRNEGPSALLRKARRRIRYYRLNRQFPLAIERARWDAIRGIHTGKRAFLIGNGPSLNRTPLYLLEGEHVMCFNRFYIMLERLQWLPTQYMCMDNLVLADLTSEIPQILPKVGMLHLPDIHFRGDIFRDSIEDHPKIHWLRQVFGRGFSTELPKVHSGGSVIYEGLQVLYHLGFREVYLLGVDMNFQIHTTAESLTGDKTDIRSQDDDDPNHFDPRYFGTNRSYHQPESFVVQNILDSLDFIGSRMDGLGLKIINAGVNSRVQTFPRTDLESVLARSPDEVRAAFERCVVSSTTFPSLASMQEAASELPQGAPLPSEGVVSTSVEDGAMLVSRAIFSHLPLGPFLGRYFFVARDDAGTGGKV